MKPLHMPIIRYSEQDDSTRIKSKQIESIRNKSNSIVNI